MQKIVRHAPMNLIGPPTMTLIWAFENYIISIPFSKNYQNMFLDENYLVSCFQYFILPWSKKSRLCGDLYFEIDLFILGSFLLGKGGNK